MNELGFCLLVLGVVGGLKVKDSIQTYWRKWKAEQKAKASVPVDLTWVDTTYDSKGRKRELGHELRLATWGRRKKK